MIHRQQDISEVFPFVASQLIIKNKFKDTLNNISNFITC